MFLSKSFFCLNKYVLPQRTLLSANLITQKFCSKAAVTENLDELYRELEVEVRGNDPMVLKSYGTFATSAASHLGIIVGSHTFPRKHSVERFTVLKSAFVHKKHRVQYEIRTYYRHLKFLRLTGSTASTFLEYLQRNLPEGVAMKVTKHEISSLPEAVNESPHITLEHDHTNKINDVVNR